MVVNGEEILPSKDKDASEDMPSADVFDSHQEQEDIAAGSIVALPMEEELAGALGLQDSTDGPWS